MPELAGQGCEIKGRIQEIEDFSDEDIMPTTVMRDFELKNMQAAIKKKRLGNDMRLTIDRRSL